MRILMLNSEYPPLGGGQGNANKYLYEEFKNYNNLEIDIITASVNEKKVEISTLGKIYYLDIGKKNTNLHWQSSKELIIYSIKSLLLAFNAFIICCLRPGHALPKSFAITLFGCSM
jgi:hypothetical protein